jgi:acetyl-CoA carboxylase biotin carboxyl carrier protein
MKPKESRKPASTAADSPEMQQIEDLLLLMNEHNLEELEYSRGDLKVRLKKPSVPVAMPAFAPRAMAAPEIIVASGSGGAQPSGSSSSSPPAADSRSTEDLHLVKSPIVGTYYESPSPGAEAFVKVGAHIETGQTLCIVEAMKLMNEIESEVTGEVLRIFVENGQPVEYNQPLFGIRPSRKK